MNGTFRQSMTWLHTWSGLVFCWILYFIFITGTLGYFDTEIDHWMKPELRLIEEKPLHENIRVGLARVQDQAPDAELWRLFPANQRTTPHLQVFWQGAPQEDGARPARKLETLNINTGEPVQARDTGGGQVLYRMHYILHYLPRDPAYYFVGIVTLIMFVGLITGIVVHKKIFKDFFTFRPQKGRRSWLDMHNLLSVSTLPFQLMITYSGLIFMLTTWMPLIALGSYGFDTDKVAALARSLRNDVEIERAGEPAALTSLYAVSDVAAQRWGEENVNVIEIKYPGDANARIIVSNQSGIARSRDRLVFDGVSGALLQTANDMGGAPMTVAATFLGLHEGLFAGPLLRWLYFLSGLLGAGMIATGAIYWTAKRKPALETERSVGFRLVESLNIGTITGLPIAIAAYFWANRLLPVEMMNRANWEVHCLFIVWALCLLHPVVCNARDAWRQQCWAAALAFALLPLINALTTDAGIVNSVNRADWVMAGFDLTALLAGLVFAIAACVMRTPVTVIAKPGPESAASVSVP